MDAEIFDGDAISRTDREFLASLDDHPLRRTPYYGALCPPPLNFGIFDPDDEAQQVARQAAFDDVVTWILANYACHKTAYGGRGGVISLVDGELVTLAGMRGLMQPHAFLSLGPKRGNKMTSVVDVWMMHQERLHIDTVQSRSDRPRPTFTEGGRSILNHYRPPAHPTTGGDITAFQLFLENLIPDATEREWFWHWLAHKARRPWLPMIAIIMVAEQFGAGRGTLFEILGLVFGENHVWPCSFEELTGKSGAARFNAHLANTLIAMVNEAVAEDGHQQARRRLHYEALKNSVDPAPTALRRYEAKGQPMFSQLSAMSVIIATNHRDVVKLPRDDRRFCVITNGGRMALADVEMIRAWMAVAENIGALYRALLATPAVPTTRFNPFDEPPPFAGRREMIGMGETRLEDAYGTAIDALDGYPLFTMTQMLRLIACFGFFAPGGAWTEKASYAVAKNAYRLRKRDEANNRIWYRKRQEVIYARTVEDQQRWHDADTKLIAAALDRTEAWIVRLANVSLQVDDLEDLARAVKTMDEQDDGGGEDDEA
jgi:hypothetical protein